MTLYRYVFTILQYIFMNMNHFTIMFIFSLLKSVPWKLQFTLISI